jgi:hypothetical protein
MTLREWMTDCRCRCSQSPTRNDKVPGEGGAQDHCHCEPRQRPHPADYHHRRESVPVPDRRESKGRGRERLAAAHGPLLGAVDGEDAGGVGIVYTRHEERRFNTWTGTELMRTLKRGGKATMLDYNGR